MLILDELINNEWIFIKVKFEISKLMFSSMWMELLEKSIVWFNPTNCMLWLEQNNNKFENNDVEFFGIESSVITNWLNCENEELNIEDWNKQGESNVHFPSCWFELFKHK